MKLFKLWLIPAIVLLAVVGMEANAKPAEPKLCGSTDGCVRLRDQAARLEPRQSAKPLPAGVRSMTKEDFEDFRKNQYNNELEFTAIDRLIANDSDVFPNSAASITCSISVVFFIFAVILLIH